MTFVWYWIARGLAAAAASLLAGPRRGDRRAMVLGAGLAAARTAEEERLAQGPTGPSPLPQESYGEGDFDLVAVEERALDRDLQALARSFASCDEDEREALRRSIDMGGLYTLLHFARRSAVFALRERSEQRCVDGLTALAMIHLTRIDLRDAVWALGLLGHAVRSVARDPRAPFERAERLATPLMVRQLREAGADQAGQLSDWGYAEIQTGRGTGLVRSGGAPYRPTIDLTTLALGLAARLSEEGRYTGEVEIASDVPSIWFAGDRRRQAERLLRRVRASVQVKGRWLGEGSPFDQLLVQWIAELRDERDAGALADCVGDAAPRSATFVAGMATGRFFVLQVGGSSALGKPPVESLRSVRELAGRAVSMLAEAGAP